MTRSKSSGNSRTPSVLILATTYLSRKPRTRLEVQQYLRKKEVDPSKIPEALVRLEEMGWLDDMAYSKKVVQERLEKGFGPRDIRFRLKKVGAPWNESLVDSDEEYQAIDKVLKKKWPGVLWKSDQKLRQKIRQFLTRRGFRWEAISRMMEDCIS